MDLEEELVQINLEISSLRTLAYILSSGRFIKSYSACTDTTEIDYYIRTKNIEAIRIWIDAREVNDITSYTVKQLRGIAASLGIAYYNELPKALLIEEIRNARKSTGSDLGTTQNTNSCSS